MQQKKWTATSICTFPDAHIAHSTTNTAKITNTVSAGNALCRWR